MSAAPVPTPNLDDILKSRGIYEAAQAAGWTPYRNGWRYPVYNSAGKQHQMMHEGKLEFVYRWKNGLPKPTDGSKYAKYLWMPGKYEKAKYYLLPDTLTAIKAARGVCYLASGEPDVLAYRAAGIRNVISRMTAEISEPVGFAEDLHTMGVSSLNYYPDRDPAGLKSAAKIKAALADSDVLYMPHVLPFEAAEKHGGDINRLWQQVGFDPHRFMSALLDCEPVDDTDLELALADDVPKSTQNRLNFDSSPMDTDKLPRAFKEAIIRDIESLPGFKRWKGSQAEFRCPFHDDTNNSAGFNTDLMAFNCFAGCGGMNAKEYGGRRGINLADYLERTEPVNTMTPPPRLTVLNAATATASTVASESRYTSSDDAWDEVRGLIDGSRLPDFTPLEFPFKTLHQFGGMAEMLEPGKVVLVLGASGGAKTTFAESATEILQREGHDVIWFSPEWNARQMRERALHRYGGLSINELRRHKLYLVDKASNVQESKRRGQLGDDAKVAKTLNLINQMQAWAGKTYVLNSVLEHGKLSGILETIEGIVQDKRAAGRKVSQLVFDYIQRVPGQTSWDKLELAVTAIKGLCERLQLIPWVIVQPTKGDGRNVRNGEDLGDSSAQGLSNQQGNLFLTLNPIFDEDGQKQPAIRVKVVKNSEGREGELILRWSPAYLTIMDQVVNEKGQPL